jgi:hypothetical protein
MKRMDALLLIALGVRKLSEPGMGVGIEKLQYDEFRKQIQCVETFVLTS